MENGKPEPIAGLLANQKACFRFMIPTAWAEPQAGLSKTVAMRQQMGFIPCIKASCMLWNAEKESLPADSEGECWDVTRARSTARLAKLKWDEVAGSET